MRETIGEVQYDESNVGVRQNHNNIVQMQSDGNARTLSTPFTPIAKSLIGNVAVLRECAREFSEKNLELKMKLRSQSTEIMKLRREIDALKVVSGYKDDDEESDEAIELSDHNFVENEIEETSISSEFESVCENSSEPKLNKGCWLIILVFTILLVNSLLFHFAGFGDLESSDL